MENNLSTFGIIVDYNLQIHTLASLVSLKIDETLLHSFRQQHMCARALIHTAHTHTHIRQFGVDEVHVHRSQFNPHF